MSTSISDGKRELGRALIAGGLLTRETLMAELERSDKKQSKMAKALMTCNFPTEDELLAVVTRNIRVPNVGIQKLRIDKETVAQLPYELAKTHKVIAYDRIGDILVVVTPHIGNAEAFAAVRKHTGCFMAPIRCNEEGFLDALEKFYEGVPRGGGRSPRSETFSSGGTSTMPANKPVTTNNQLADEQNALAEMPTVVEKPGQRPSSETVPVPGGGFDAPPDSGVSHKPRVDPIPDRPPQGVVEPPQPTVQPPPRPNKKAASPGAVVPLDIDPKESNGAVALEGAYFDVVSIWEQRFAGSGPIPVEADD